NKKAGIMIRRPIEYVFSFVVDMDHLPQWARAVVAAQRTTLSPPGVGTTYRIVGRLAGRDVASTYELTAFAPPATFAAVGTIGPFPLRAVYTFTATPSGPR